MISISPWLCVPVVNQYLRMQLHKLRVVLRSMR